MATISVTDETTDRSDAEAGPRGDESGNPTTASLKQNHDIKQADGRDGNASHAFPDGGTSAWMTVLGAFCCYFSSYGWISSMGVFQTFYEQAKLPTYSASAISWILSVQVFALSAFAPLAGKVFDSYGCDNLIRVGSLLHILGLMMLSISEKYWQVFLAQSVCSGLGVATIFHGATNAVSTWFLKHRGLATGLASSGAAIGGLVMPYATHPISTFFRFGGADMKLP